ncbi:MAG: hypothetical protein K0S38_134 [Candidatus Paceibacter sp.]|jgi:hypothetical protein|nr:hypothetical protein [Candidatus Paceibacter sp.]
MKTLSQVDAFQQGVLSDCSSTSHAALLLMRAPGCWVIQAHPDNSDLNVANLGVVEVGQDQLAFWLCRYFVQCQCVDRQGPLLDLHVENADDREVNEIQRLIKMASGLRYSAEHK